MKKFQELDRDLQVAAFNYVTSHVLNGILMEKKELKDFSNNDDDNFAEDLTWVTNKIKSFYKLAMETKDVQKVFLETLQKDRDIQSVFYPFVEKIVNQILFTEKDEILIQENQVPVRLEDNEVGVFKKETVIIKDVDKQYLSLEFLKNSQGD